MFHLHVAPLRVRGLKHDFGRSDCKLHRRTFTGAWIETSRMASGANKYFVAPLRVRGLKPLPASLLAVGGVAPLRVRGLKRRYQCICTTKHCRTFTGAWIETLLLAKQ